MHTIQLRNVPDRVYEELVTSARTNHRSLANEALSLLESALVPHEYPRSPDLFREILAVREDIAKQHGTASCSVELIREDRDA